MTLYRFATNSAIASVREITHDGKRYLIAPVVALRAGVVNGYLVPNDELAKYAEAWAGRPICLDHPQANGQYVSANAPDLAAQHPGMLWNMRVDGDALKGEMWLDLDKVQKLGGAALSIVQRLRANQPVEVSTGYFADIEDKAGQYGGKQYNGVQRNIRPDHLALLPNGQGACNWRDGCGAPRVNERGLMNDELTTNELALDDRLHLVRRAFREQMAKMAGPTDDPWEMDMIGVFDETLIAKDWKAKAHMAYPYTLTDAGEVQFGDPMPVDVVYRAKDNGAEIVVANTQTTEQQERGLFRRFVDWWQQQQPDLTGNATTKIDGGQTYTKSDYLYTPSDNVSEWKLRVAEYVDGKKQVTAAQVGRAVAALSPGGFRGQKVQIPAGDMAGVKRKLRSLWKRFHGDDETMPAYLMANSERMDDMTKDELITALVANARCKFAQDALEAWEEGALQTLHDSLATPDPEPASRPGTSPSPQANAVELPAEITAFAQMLQGLGGVAKLGEALGQITANADQERTQLVQGILANERNSFEEPELQAMSTAQLRKMASILAPRSYLGAAGVLNGQGPDEEVLAMPVAWPEQARTHSEGGN